MTTKPVWVALAAAALLALPASAGTGSELVLEDAVGDEGPRLPGGTTVFTGKPVDDGADLRRVTVTSAGGAALVVRFEVGADPQGGPPLGFALDTALGDCSSTFAAVPEGGPSGTPYVGWFQSGESCPDQSDLDGFGSVASDPRWTLTVGETDVVLHLPLDTLTEAQARLLRPGAVLAAPSGRSFLHLSAGTSEEDLTQVRPAYTDETAPGRDWVLGEDAEEQPAG